MSDLGHDIGSAVRVDWSEERLQAARAGLGARRRRRAVMRTGLTAGLVAAMLIGVWFEWPRDARGPVAMRPPEPSLMLRFEDGSTAVRVDRAGQLRTTLVTPGRVVMELARGAARFEVIDDRTRVFRVVSGPVTVEAFGAVFACSRQDQQTRIEVFRGTLRVMWGDQERELTAGETAVVPPIGPAPAPAPAPVPEPIRVPPHPPVRVVKGNWRDLARDGEFDQAYAALERPDAPEVRDEPEELLLVADVKRLSHHPTEAIAPLRKVVRDHARDPRASLAAFTLGRVLLEELGRPAEAAVAFKDAVTLAPDGPMAEDAIARTVEALSRAGDATGAQHLAEDYLKRFPEGRKARSVRRFGGLE